MTDQTPNQQRAGYAAVTLDSSRHYEAYDQVGVQDFLSDLMHLCREGLRFLRNHPRGDRQFQCGSH